MIWKPIIGYDGLYEVSSTGLVRSMPRMINNRWGGSHFTKGRILAPKTDRYGYKALTLFNDGVKKHFTIHRLVATAFLENNENKPQVNHINGKRDDNRVENLEWATAKENVRHSFDVLNRVGNKTTCKPVIMCSVNNEPMFIFPDIVTAASFVGGKISNISHAATGRNKSAYKLNWKFA